MSCFLFFVTHQQLLDMSNFEISNQSQKTPTTEDVVKYYEKQFNGNFQKPNGRLKDLFYLAPHYTMDLLIWNALYLLSYGVVLTYGCPISYSSKPYMKNGKWQRVAYHPFMVIKCTSLDIAKSLQQTLDSVKNGLACKIHPNNEGPVTIGPCRSIYAAETEVMANEELVSKNCDELRPSGLLIDMSVLAVGHFDSKDLLEDIKRAISRSGIQQTFANVQFDDKASALARCHPQVAEAARENRSVRMYQALTNCATAPEFLRLNGYIIQNFDQKLYNCTLSFGGCSGLEETAKESVPALLELQEYGLYIIDSKPQETKSKWQQLAHIEFCWAGNDIPSGFLQALQNDSRVLRWVCRCQKGKITEIIAHDKGVARAIQIMNDGRRALLTSETPIDFERGDMGYEPQYNFPVNQPVSYLFFLSSPDKIDMASQLLAHVRKYFTKQYHYANKEASDIDHFRLEDSSAASTSHERARNSKTALLHRLRRFVRKLFGRKEVRLHFR